MAEPTTGLSPISERRVGVPTRTVADEQVRQRNQPPAAYGRGLIPSWPVGFPRNSPRETRAGRPNPQMGITDTVLPKMLVP